jgi:hypothetical protein
MAFSRYNRAQRSRKDGKQFISNSTAGRVIKQMVDSGQLQTKDYVLSNSQRLDVVAANFYGDAKYWWVIAAASGIGWQCQVPAGTLLKVPVSLQKILNMVG